MTHLDELEMALRMQLAEIHAAYREQAKPILAQLVRIECLRPPKPFIVDAKLLPGFSPD